MSHILNHLLSSTNSITSETNLKYNQYNYYANRAWCQTENSDYCPLVIALMSFIILISFILIVYICACSTFKCISIRNIFNRQSTNLNQRTSSLHRSPSNISTQSTVNRIHPILNNTQSQTVWSTDLSKYSRPPPTYEESQLVKPSRVIRTYPRKFANINNAFTMENIIDNTINSNSTSINGQILFPSYRCLSLTTSPSTRTTLERLNRIIDENCIREQILTTDLLNQFNLDEIPPSYDSVVTPELNENVNKSFRLRNNSIYV